MTSRSVDEVRPGVCERARSRSGGETAAAFPPRLGFGDSKEGVPCLEFYAGGEQGDQRGRREPEQEREVYPWMATSDRSRRRGRQSYSRHQSLELEKEFLYSRYPTNRRRVEVSSALGLTETQVKIWFQNRRMKWKREQKRNVLYSPGESNLQPGGSRLEESEKAKRHGGSKDEGIKLRKQRGS